MPKSTAKQKVCVSAMVPESHREYLLSEARKRDLSLSELVRRMLDEMITTAREAKAS